jgi:hypothetical protein
MVELHDGKHSGILDATNRRQQIIPKRMRNTSVQCYGIADFCSICFEYQRMEPCEARTFCLPLEGISIFEGLPESDNEQCISSNYIICLFASSVANWKHRE